METKSFLGIGWAFPPTFSGKVDFTEMTEGEADIKQSLLILLSTVPGERVHRPEYGCGIHKMVYEKMNSNTMTLFKHMIEKAVLLFEPRITLNDIQFNFNNENEGLLEIQLNYTVRLTNSRSNIVYPFYLREGTNIRING